MYFDPRNEVCRPQKIISFDPQNVFKNHKIATSGTRNHLPHKIMFRVHKNLITKRHRLL